MAERTAHSGGEPLRAPRPGAGEPTRLLAGSGFVSLVGAGPGDPGLLTVRALELLRSADVIAHDELIPLAILSAAREDAEIVSVGRRHGAGSVPYRLHPLVLERAREGLHVVRLKSGDPFIFGRGGEEAEELVEAGIPYEVVPGVSSALGSAAYAGIPLTHRSCATQVTLATGHEAPGAAATPARVRGEGTVVLFMAVRRLSENLQRLVEGGRSPSTPAAYVASATTPRQRIVVGTLADLAEKVAGSDPTEPGLVIVGEVVSLRERIAWLDRRPLFGHRVLVARSRPGRSELVERLRRLGAEVLEAPSVEALPLEDVASLDEVLERLHQFEAVVFGCGHGVDAVLGRLNARGKALKVAAIAIGQEASERLRRARVPARYTTPGACREVLTEQLASLQRSRVLLVTSSEGRPQLQSELASLGVSVETVTAYDVRCRFPHALYMPPVDLVVLPCSSAARSLLTSGLSERVRHVPMVAMGSLTQASAQQHGATRVSRAEEDSVPSLLSSVLAELTGPRNSEVNR